MRAVIQYSEHIHAFNLVSFLLAMTGLRSAHNVSPQANYSAQIAPQPPGNTTDPVCGARL